MHGLMPNSLMNNSITPLSLYPSKHFVEIMGRYHEFLSLKVKIVSFFFLVVEYTITVV